MIEIRTLRDLLRLFFIFKLEFKLAVATTLTMIVLGAFLLPTSFESSARLLVKPGTSTLPIEMADRQSSVMLGGQRDEIVDEERLLTGQPIIQLVAEHYLDVISNAPPPQGFFATIKYGLRKIVAGSIDILRSGLQLLGLQEAQTPVERLANKLEKSFSVSHATGSTVMEISFVWDNPAVAQEILASWIDLYMQERNKVLGRKSLSVFYEAESNKSEEQILNYKKEIITNLNNIQATSIEDRLRDLSERINLLRSDRFNSTRLIAATEQSIETLARQLKTLPREVRTVREMSLNPAQQHILTLLNDKRAERQDLLRTYTDQAPPIKTIDESIVYLEKLANSEAATVQSSENLAPNPIAERLQSNYYDQQSDLNRLKAQLAKQETQLATLEGERNKALNAEPEISRLQRALSMAEKNSALYRESLENSRIERELDNSRISNISVIQHATLNPTRVFPKSLLMLALSIPAGLIVGLLALYLCYLLDQRIHDGGLIEERFGVPLWTTLQDMGDAAPWQNSAFIASIYRLYGQLPLDQVEEQGLTVAITSARRGEGVSFVIEHFSQLLIERGHKVRIDGDESAQPGEIALLDACGVIDNQDAFIKLRKADLITLVVEAQKSTVPVIEHTLSIINTAFQKVDGIIVNRRRFEIPSNVLNLMSRIRSLI